MYVVFKCVCSEFDIFFDDPVGQFSLVRNSVCGRAVTSWACLLEYGKWSSWAVTCMWLEV